MKCIIPKYSGFCSGVSLAVRAAYENLDGRTFMLGEVVNNPSVVRDLTEKGLKLVHSTEEITQENANVLIRAHGVPEKTLRQLSEKNLGIIDKTCPKVKHVHDIVAKASARGLDIIIVGTPNHPEIIGTVGWSKTKTILLYNLEDAKKILPGTRFSEKGVCMVAQTTHNEKAYHEIYDYCTGLIPNIEFHNTICSATANRQNEIRELAKTCDTVLVVGGKTSSNVTKLYEIASEYCANTQHVETAADIDVSRLKGMESVVVSTGASTPDASIEDTIKMLQSYCDSNGLTLQIIKLATPPISPGISCGKTDMT